MKLHTALISYDRPDLTVRAAASYLATVTVEHSLTVVDNGSSEETLEILRGLADGHFRLLELGENRYPGYAANRVWETLPDGPDVVLHRADNDFEFLPGWCEEVERRLLDERIGQLGLRTNEEELNAPYNVGGNCVVRRSLWDAGLRWDERPWEELRGTTEDYYLSRAVLDHGLIWARVRRRCIRSISRESLDDPYYQKTWLVRDIVTEEQVEDARRRAGEAA